MFDSYSSTRMVNNIKVQACPGGIYKSHPKSKFINFQLESEVAKSLLFPADRIPELRVCESKYDKNSYKNIEVEILQILTAMEESIKYLKW